LWIIGGDLLEVATRYSRLGRSLIVDDRIRVLVGEQIPGAVFGNGSATKPCFTPRLIFQPTFEATGCRLAVQPLTFAVADPSHCLATFVATVTCRAAGRRTTSLIASRTIAKRRGILLAA
jgi:hypothetical protein